MPTLSVAFTVRSPFESIETVQSTWFTRVWRQTKAEVPAVVPPRFTDATETALSSVTWMVVSVMEALEMWVGAVIVMTGGVVSMT